MKKAKIVAISKNTKKSVYTIENAKIFFDNFKQFLVDIGFEKTSNDVKFFMISEEEYYNDPDYKKKVKNDKNSLPVNDFYYFAKNKDFDIELIVGNRKIILIVRSEKQDVFLQSLQKFCELPKEK